MRTDDPMYNLADRCLFPVGAARFLQEFYTDRCGVFRPGDDIDPDTLLSLEQIEMTLAASGAFETASVAMRVPGSAQPGFVRSMADVYDALSKGQGLQIARYDRLLAFDHPLSQMFRAFGVLCRAPCHGMTVFLSPPGAVLPAHNDPFEIFTLQVQGTKTWRIHGFAPPQTGTDVQIDVDAPVEIHHLSRGDIFYVPKGIVHDVLPGDGHSQEGFSLSVALIYRPPAWESLVQEIATDLAQDRRFWRSLPPDGLVDGIEHRRALLHAAIDAMDTEALANRIEATRQAGMPTAPAMHLEAAMDIDAIQPETLLRIRPGPVPKLVDQGGQTLLHSAHDTPIRIPQAGRDAVQFMLESTAPFAVGDVSMTLSDSSKLALARKLARRGLLLIVSGN